jgi:uncharacterized protein YqgC (DUF456 family)
MIDVLTSALSLTTILAMMITVVVSFIPFVPGPFLLWAIALTFGFLTSFTPLTPFAFIIITLLMIVGSTTDIWMPFVGMRARGTSFGGILAGIVGALLGTVIIPLPILGTLAGAALGAITVEYLNAGRTRALRAGASAAESYVLSIAVEFIINSAIVLTFIISVVTMT